MKNVKILDCTLRDGGRIIDCKFEDLVINNISNNLADAGIEVIELGFLRSENLVDYNGNSTFFTTIEQMDPFISDVGNVLYTAFVDYKMFDFDKLELYRGHGIEGIRVGFTKKQYIEETNSIFEALQEVKSKGYKLFVQTVNTPGYSDREILDLIEKVNKLNPYGFGIVDTYGALYLEDMTHLFDIVDHNLKKSIAIDIHSHNNMQSSFAFSQEIMRIAPSDRKLIFDTTLNGMGKCAGNLNTELIVDYLNRKKDSNYDLDKILDTIDQYLSPIKEKYEWGYSIPAFMAGIYKSHPNNIIYLTEKYRLSSKDIKYIISGIDEGKRQRYDYDNISSIYREYVSTIFDDTESLKELKHIIKGRKVVLLAPGRTVKEYEDKIKNVVNDNDALVISINFIPNILKPDFVFCANPIHWKRLRTVKDIKYIISSNIKEDTCETYKVNYASIIEEDSIIPDNSMIMLINLMYKVGAEKAFIAGFDGMRENEENYVSNSFLNSPHGIPLDQSNSIISKLYSGVNRRYSNKMAIELITPSLYIQDQM